ncbi:MAG: TetR/AcrR family transcriptional regulator [Fidelibacterota bacterium]|nr:MAG: TetR/AcrR family transcriptional regulator [Candidatus Neomarinimicrobiota bacterium]
MIRISKDYDVRKQEFLDAAQKLFYEQGYDQTSVNTIIDYVGVSKGTFYHYFKSKEDLLDALAERVARQRLEQLHSIVEDRKLSALEKFNGYFAGSRGLIEKSEDIAKAVLRVMYEDENILLRHKARVRSMELVVPELGKIIAQGVQEGTFNVPYPERTAEMILMLGGELKDIYARLFLELDEKPENISLAKQLIDQYEDAITRMLAAPEGSIRFHEQLNLRDFLV